ncbi:Sec-independent protein translocase protein TatB [Aurantimonas sp. VKM B-3413]|uniref:Sec-independent protein translocase protein TatB n=1 Tax=Aurantimonas sp. VKM B-3413 TaxID=2779401 RepID=UPI001E5B7D27|nr:Sec-independent protein translocase protein TatB [Aurantimonas sp. VKM B-3413]MCB8836676.1 Sec-independent protein translocase protein TatB [Aurantimonas sp. VKM B-3413]
MFDIGWSELLVVAVVLVVVVGPKDLPGMLRTFGRTTKQLRAMAGDFRRQFDEALKEAELDDVRTTVNEMRELDPRRNLREALNPMRAIGDEIRSSLNTATKAPEPKVPDADEALTKDEAKASPAASPAPSAAAPAAQPTNSSASNVASPAKETGSAGNSPSADTGHDTAARDTAGKKTEGVA